MRGELSASELESLALIGLSGGLGVKGHARIVPGLGGGEVVLGLVWVYILGNCKQTGIHLVEQTLTHGRSTSSVRAADQQPISR